MTTPRKYLVTGATSGIGHAIAKELARRGTALAVVGRDRNRLTKLGAELRSRGAAAVEEYQADLSVVAAMRQLARAIAEAGPLHGMVLGAGVLEFTRRLTSDGFELNYAVNHLHKFVLLEALAPGLASRRGRVVIGAPVGAVKGSLDDVRGDRSWSMLKGVATSQWANDALALEVARRYGDQGLATVAWNPGPTRGTNITRSMPFWARGVFWLATVTGRSLANVGSQGADLVTALDNRPLTCVRGAKETSIPVASVNQKQAAQTWSFDQQLLTTVASARAG